jgi:chitinase
VTPTIPTLRPLVSFARRPGNEDGCLLTVDFPLAAWVIMVGCPSDVQSLEKRHGSHLDVFNCPDTHPDDFSVQSLRAVCTEESPDNNCEDIFLGGAENTVLRLPAGCGPDVYVRVVSFARLENATAPAHLTKRLVNDPKVYEIRYDYDFGKVREKKERQKRGLDARADGCGDIYFRVDSSDQENYWHGEYIHPDTLLLQKRIAY